MSQLQLRSNTSNTTSSSSIGLVKDCKIPNVDRRKWMRENILKNYDFYVWICTICVMFVISLFQTISANFYTASSISDSLPKFFSVQSDSLLQLSISQGDDCYINVFCVSAVEFKPVSEYTNRFPDTGGKYFSPRSKQHERDTRRMLCVGNKCRSLIISSGSYKQPSVSPEQNLSSEPVSGKAKDEEDDTIAPTSSVTSLTMSP